jgi:hypothetical protein
MIPLVCSENRTALPNPTNPQPTWVSSTAMRWPTKPLRLIVSRTPVFDDIYSNGTQKLMWYLDSLSCGHQTVVYPYDEIAGKKRHRCSECAQIASQKKAVRAERRRIQRAARKVA